jgi:photosynthetic reaction center cytochrome c subunit
MPARPFLATAKSSLRFLVMFLLAAASAAAQMPDKFTNLKVLPKDISKPELMGTMRRFAFALGVRCEHCHVQNADHKFDFAADDKEAKKTARVMLQMVAAINRDYVGKLPKENPIQVECVTCHHGLAQPRPLNAVLAEAIDKQGIDAAVKLYRDLREKYYGTGEYDFGETPLNQLTESLLAKKKFPEAVAVMEMHFDANHPTTLWSYHMLAMAHQSAGDIERTKADYRKVLELHPDDSWAKDQLEALSKPKS